LALLRASLCLGALIGAVQFSSLILLALASLFFFAN
jgi:hypothetical protein